LVLEVLEQSGDLELVGRDSSLNANTIVGQPFLKIVEESSEIHVHVVIPYALRSEMECWSTGVLGFKSMSRLLLHSCTSVP